MSSEHSRSTPHEKMSFWALTFGERWESFPLKAIWELRRRFQSPDGNRGGEAGLRNLSKMAMTKNMEMRMAVATKPKETAFTELSKLLLQCWSYSSLCTFSGAPIGGHPLLMLLCSLTILPLICLILLYHSGQVGFCSRLRFWH